MTIALLKGILNGRTVMVLSAIHNRRETMSYHTLKTKRSTIVTKHFVKSWRRFLIGMMSILTREICLKNSTAVGHDPLRGPKD